MYLIGLTPRADSLVHQHAQAGPLPHDCRMLLGTSSINSMPSFLDILYLAFSPCPQKSHPREISMLVKTFLATAGQAPDMYQPDPYTRVMT